MKETTIWFSMVRIHRLGTYFHHWSPIRRML